MIYLIIIYNDSNSNYFDKMFPILMGFFVFLFVFLISGITLLRERTTGTLERVLSTSIRRNGNCFRLSYRLRNFRYHSNTDYSAIFNLSSQYSFSG